MKRLLALAILLFPLAAQAQVVNPPVGIAAMVCANNTVVPTPTSGQFFYVQCDSSGKLITTGSATAGTVTSVSVTTANGVSGTVATPTTTPAITLTLGAITPSSVAVGVGSAITSSGPGGTLTSLAYTSPGTGVATALGNTAGGAGGFALVGTTPPTGSAGGDLTGTYPNPTIKSSVSLTTPVIGVATGTSLALGGCTITGFSLCTTGSASIGNILNANSISITNFKFNPSGTTITFPGTASANQALLGYANVMSDAGGSSNPQIDYLANAYFSGGPKFTANGFAHDLVMNNGTITAQVSSASGTAAGAITWVPIWTATNGTFTLAGTNQLNVAAMTQTAVAQSGTVCYNSGTGAVTYDATLGCLASTMRVKENWQEIGPSEALAEVIRMRPGSYTYKSGMGLPSGEQIGLAAEQMADVDDRLVAYDNEGLVRGTRYQQASALYPAAIRQLKADNDNLRVELEELKLLIKLKKEN